MHATEGGKGEREREKGREWEHATGGCARFRWTKRLSTEPGQCYSGFAVTTTCERFLENTLYVYLSLLSRRSNGLHV